MATRLNPYLRFHGNAREAMEFYQIVFGGSLDINTYADLHADEDPADSDLVIHSTVTGSTGLVIMASDIPPRDSFSTGEAFSVSLSGDNEQELTAYWTALSADGTIQTAFERSPWGAIFGTCVDRFGISWIINVMAARPR